MRKSTFKSTFYTMSVSNGSKLYAYALKVSNNFNLWPIMEAINEVAKIETLNACDSKAEAIETARAWNQVWSDEDRIWLNAPGFNWVIW